MVCTYFRTGLPAKLLWNLPTDKNLTSTGSPILAQNIHIDLREALLGFERTLKHLDGHEVHIDRRDKVTKPGLMERFKGEGMPVFEQYSEVGDLMVTFIVDLPDKLSDE